MTEQQHLVLELKYVSIDIPIPCEDNPRILSPEMRKNLKNSLLEFGFSKPIVLNSAKGRENIILEGHQRLIIAKELGMKEVPVVYISISDPKKEQILRLAYNKITADWDMEKLAKISEDILEMAGFSSEELDEVFDIDTETTPEIFDIEKELKKLKIDKIEIKTGDIFQLGDHRIMCGDSTKEEDILALMNGEKADACITDEPYILNYAKGRRQSKKSEEGFGYKKNRKYIGTETLEPDFMSKWMANVHKIQKENFAIISFECWKNLKDMWIEMEKYWKIKNMIIWNCPNRMQGFAAKYRFFNKYDICFLGESGNTSLNLEKEEETLQNEYEAALFATSGSPTWEGYKKNKKYCPTDHITFNTDDEKHSGQGLVFGCKPIPLLLPYMKVLTKRGDIVIEPFGGSGSTLVCAEKLKRRCYLMEKCPIYAEVIRKRWETLTGLKAVKLTK